MRWAAWVLLCLLLVVGLFRMPRYVSYYDTGKFIVWMDYFFCYATTRALSDGMANVYGGDIVAFEKKLSGGLYGYPDNHPPPFYLYFRPTNRLPFQDAFLVHDIFAVAAFAAVVFLLSGFLIGDRRRALRVAGLTTLAVLVSGIGIDNLYLGQVSILMAAALGLAFYLDARGQQMGAGFFLACAILLKMFPALLCVYFFCHRRYRTLLGCLATLLGLSILAGFLWGFHHFVNFTQHIGEYGYYMMDQNQAFMGWLVMRIPAGLPAMLLKEVHMGLMAVLVGLLWSLSKRRTAGNRVRDLLEYSCYLLAAMLAAPFSWPHHHILVALPTLAAVALCFEDEAMSPRWLLAGGVTLALYWAMEGEVLAKFWTPAGLYLAYGCGMWMMLWLLVWCAWSVK